MSHKRDIIDPELLLQGYANGIFPMAESRDTQELFWVDPSRRGIIPLDGFHTSRSLVRRIRRGGYDVSLNRDFSAVLDHCADRSETWISNAIRALYLSLYEKGHAHSLEIWQDGALTGGVYGVTLGAAFFGESMFSKRTDASKLALAHMIDHLKRCGYVLFDTQFLTPHLESLGAIEISRARYHELLEAALKIDADMLSQPLSDLQLST